MIVCPASLKENWRREFTKFDTKGLSVEIVKKSWPITNVVIINYDVLKKWRKELRQEFHLMILDEVHYLKNGKADRTKEVFGGIKRNASKQLVERIPPIRADRRLLLTGTPILSIPKEIWNLIKTVDPNGLGADWFTFAKRYCQLFEIKRFNPSKGKEERVGWDWSGADNLEELQTLMRGRFMVRRLKKDVLKELPPKTRQIIVLEAKKGLTKLLESERLAYDTYISQHGEETDPPAFTEMSKIRKEVGAAKVPYVVDYVKELLDEQSKIVCFAHHHEVLDKLAEEFPGIAVKLDGRTSQEDRQKAIDSFQNDPKIRLFFGSIQAAGTGITLTAANIGLFAELTFVPAMITQCEDRLHRIGQQENVLIHHVVLNDSLDQRILELLVKKQEIADKALDKEN